VGRTARLTVTRHSTAPRRQSPTRLPARRAIGRSSSPGGRSDISATGRAHSAMCGAPNRT
jgi:hypothetical protein